MGRAREFCAALPCVARIFPIQRTGFHAHRRIDAQARKRAPDCARPNTGSVLFDPTQLWHSGANIQASNFAQGIYRPPDTVHSRANQAAPAEVAVAVVAAAASWSNGFRWKH